MGTAFCGGACDVMGKWPEDCVLWVPAPRQARAATHRTLRFIRASRFLGWVLVYFYKGPVFVMMSILGEWSKSPCCEASACRLFGEGSVGTRGEGSVSM